MFSCWPSLRSFSRTRVQLALVSGGRWDSEIIVPGALPRRGRKGRWESKEREALQIQKHDDMCNLIAHHIQNHQAKELIDALLGLPLVEPESRAAIGARLKQVPLPGSGEER